MPLVSTPGVPGGSLGSSMGITSSSTPSVSTLPSTGVYLITAGLVAQNLLPVGGVPNTVLVALTDVGAILIARRLVEGLGFKIVGFRVGSTGYDPNDPTQAAPLNPADTALGNTVFPTHLLPPEAIDRYESPNDYGISFLCRVASGEAISGIGEIGIFAQITSSPLNPSEVGTYVLFAHAHRPLFGKTTNDVMVWRMVCQW
mgnify:CR=1 FL=1